MCGSSYFQICTEERSKKGETGYVDSSKLFTANMTLLSGNTFGFTCQGQELAAATSPPTTLAGLSSRYLGSGGGAASAC